LKISEAIENITNFRNKGINWLRMAEIVSTIEKSGSWTERYASRTEWIQEAARVSGYGLRVIYRMLKVKAFLDMMVETEKLLLPEGADIPLASIEVIQRLHPLQQDMASQLLGRAIRGDVTLKEVQKVYDNIVCQNLEKAGKKKVLPRLVHNFEESAVLAVLQNPHIFMGKGKFQTVQEFRGPYGLVVDLIAFKNTPIPSVFGFEFKYIHDELVQRKSFYDLLQKVVFTSQFFKRFWIVFVADVGEKAVADFSEDLKKLQLYNVGIALVKPMVESDSKRIELKFANSIYRPEIISPQEDGFFPSDKEFSGKWEHLVLEHVRSMPTELLSKKIIKRR